MYETAVILTSITMLTATLWYIVLVVRGEIRPVLASWIIFATTMTIGFWSYWNSPKHSWTGNIGNLMGVASTVPILLAIAFIQLTRKEFRIKFSRFQIGCLTAAGFILLLWGLLRFEIGNENAATLSNVLTQILMVIGYVALAQRLWKATEDTESLFTWTMIFLASLFCLYPSYVREESLGLLYGIRASITSAITVWLVLRVRAKVARLQSASAC